MRSRNICPKCSGQDLLVVDPWRQPQSGSTLGANQVCAASVHRVSRGFLATNKRYDVGGFELWVCAQCGYSELYASGVEELMRLAADETDDVRRVQVKGEGGAYR